MKKDIFQINVREILRSKAPGLYKKIPSFIVSGLEKLIRQEDLNRMLFEYSDYRGHELMEKFREDFNITLKIVGEENIPDLNTKCIFASNHPLGGLDGICLSAYLGQKYNGHIEYLVNDLLYFIEPLQDIFIPINKHGSQAKNGVTALNEAFASENQIITFPAGLCSRKIDGAITDLEWKKMFIVKAVEFERDIVPVYFEAKNSNFFYNLANFRKRFDIKFNIEMLFLPREMFKNSNNTFTIYFGKPIPWKTFNSSKTPQQWANWIKDIVYSKQ